MEGAPKTTFSELIEELNSLVPTWKNLGSFTAQPHLKLLIDSKIKQLSSAKCAPEPGWCRPRKYGVLNDLANLGNLCLTYGYETNLIDDAILEEVESMMADVCIITPKTFETQSVAADETPTINRYPFTLFKSTEPEHGSLFAEDGTKPFFLEYMPMTQKYVGRIHNGDTLGTLGNPFPIDPKKVAWVRYNSAGHLIVLNLKNDTNSWNNMLLFLRMISVEVANNLVKDLCKFVHIGSAQNGLTSAQFNQLWNGFP